MIKNKNDEQIIIDFLLKISEGKELPTEEEIYTYFKYNISKNGFEIYDLFFNINTHYLTNQQLNEIQLDYVKNNEEYFYNLGKIISNIYPFYDDNDLKIFSKLRSYYNSIDNFNLLKQIIGLTEEFGKNTLGWYINYLCKFKSLSYYYDEIDILKLYIKELKENKQEYENYKNYLQQVIKTVVLI